MGESVVPIDLSEISCVPTPATTSFLSLLGTGAHAEAVRVLDENWVEIWYAIDPMDLKGVLLALPADAYAHFDNAAYLNALVGTELAGHAERTPAADDREARLNQVAREIADLRLSGRPAEAMALVHTVAEDVRGLRGRLVDTSGGRTGIWLVQTGITALLAGDLTTARVCFDEAARSHRPVRFPFVQREAVAKLALVHAVAGDPNEAATWLTKAEQLTRTDSWVEKLVDDSLWLSRYICAVDALELDLAERLRRAQPSPLAHLEFWGIALQAQVRHLCLTARAARARELCDEMAASGLPLPGSDGWLGSMLDDARLMCTPPRALPDDGRPSAADALLARRRHLLATGQYRQLTTRDGEEALPRSMDARTRLGLDLLRGQGMLHAGRRDHGRQVVLDALADAMDRGALSVLSHLAAATLDLIDDTEPGARARRLVAEHRLQLIEVTVLSSPLTPAETRVLGLLREGRSRQEIAEASYVSLETVKSQLTSAYRKLGVTKRADAIARLDQMGW